MFVYSTRSSFPSLNRSLKSLSEQKYTISMMIIANHMSYQQLTTLVLRVQSFILVDYMVCFVDSNIFRQLNPIKRNI